MRSTLSSFRWLSAYDHPRKGVVYVLVLAHYLDLHVHVAFGVVLAVVHVIVPTGVPSLCSCSERLLCCVLG